jgi:anaerobic selenocysteine-containing dehydrogenase
MTMAQTTERSAYRICPLCEACCGLEIKVAGDKVLAIRGHPADVFSAGYICPKAVALKDLHEDPDRLRRPLVKRDGEFVEASWDEAFAEIERRLVPIVGQHGRDAVAVSVGNPSAHKMSLLLYFSRLAKALGTKNVYSASTLDQMPKQLSSGLMFGHWLSIAVPDIERSDFLLILGANPAASNGSLWTVPDFRGKAKALRARGARIVVIDPRRSETAALADAHHFIRPGSDVFLLAAMVHTLFEENLARLGRLEDHVAGVQAVRSAVADFTAEAAAARCGIAADTIRGLARELAAAPRGCVYARIGTCTQAYGTLASWLVDVLNVLTGHLDEPGGAMFPRAAAFAHNTVGKPGVGRGITTGRHTSRVSGAPEVFGELPAGVLAEEIETPGPGQVRALISIASNPVLSAPNGARLAAALDSLDFMVSLDIYLNETTRHADVILPGLSPLQDSHYDVAFPQLSFRNHARYSGPVFDAPADQPPEWQNLLRLAAIALGRGAQADVLALDDELVAGDAARPGPAARPRAAQRPLRRCLRRAARRPEPGPRDGGAGRHRPRRAAAAHPRSAAHAERPHRARTGAAAGRPAACRRRTRPFGAGRPAHHRPARRAQQQQLDAQPAAARQGPATLHAADAPGRRTCARPRRRAGGRHQRPRPPRERAGGAERHDDARRRQPAARLGPRPARHAARGCRRAAGREPERAARRSGP